MSGAPAIDAARVIADLHDLADLTGDERGAQRLCWGPVWERARDFLCEHLSELGVEPEIDEAGNLHARLPGADRDAPALAVGSHLDSVPDGGWLDGALGVMAALGALRAWVAAPEAPPRDLLLIDFADEEGARFGRSLFGSSSMAGTLEPAELEGLTDAAGERIGEVLSECGVDLAAAPRAAERLEGIGAFLELHIEQGPALEAEGASCAAVSGCAGVERHTLTFRGQSSHAGTTPMDMRRDAGLAAAETALLIERVAREHAGVGTCGRVALSPGVVTAVAGTAELAVDLRHPEPGPLADMLGAVAAGAERIAAERGCQIGREPIWRIEPIRFDPGLAAAAERACAGRGGRERAMPSGALHDAAELARRVPAVLVFCASREGISHAREEDSSEDDLTAAIEAYGELVAATLGVTAPEAG